MGKENFYPRGTIQSPMDILNGPVEVIVRTEDGRYNAKHMSAVVFASAQIANGVSTKDALETSKEIFQLTRRNQIASTLTSARKLIK